MTPQFVFTSPKAVEIINLMKINGNFDEYDLFIKDEFSVYVIPKIKKQKIELSILNDMRMYALGAYDVLRLRNK